MKSAIVVALTGFGLAACIGPRGRQFEGTMFPASADIADQDCRRELPNDVIWPSSWPEAHGMSADQQRNHYYQKCMEIMGHPGATLQASTPSQTSPQ